MGSPPPPPPPKFNYHSGGGGGGLKLPGSGGNGAGGAGGGALSNEPSGQRGLVSGFRWTPSNKGSTFFELDLNFGGPSIVNGSLVSPGRGYYINNVVDITFIYVHMGTSFYSNSDNDLSEYELYSEQTLEAFQSGVTIPNRFVQLDVIERPTFKITEINDEGGLIDGVVQSPGLFRFYFPSENRYINHESDGLSTGVRNIGGRIPAGGALGVNSPGSQGTNGLKGAGGGGWAAKGGDTGSLTGGNPGAAIESSFTGFDPLISGSGKAFGTVENLGQTPPE